MTQPKTPNPRRRKRSKWQNFTEAYLPVLVVAAILVGIILLMVSFFTGEENDPQPSETTQATQDPNQLASWEQEAKDLLAQAELAARDYDYHKAVMILESFSGEIADFPMLSQAHQSYLAAAGDLVEWTAAQVTQLSLHNLIAQPERAFDGGKYSASYQKNFLTIPEFNSILQQLYNGGYILVDWEDLYESSYDDSIGREVYSEIPLLLPSGKKPLLLTQVNVNYYSYMVDGNNDGRADADGDGFAAKLCYSEDQGFYNELVLSDGSTASGAYDMVPLLEAFLEQHGDFSYRGARATIAITGYDGILGHRTNSTKLTKAERDQARADARTVAQALRDQGYTLASYSFANIDYKVSTPEELQTDLEKWQNYVVPYIGEVDIMIYARNSDIGGPETYSGSKFTLLHNAGFRIFSSVSSELWNQVDNLYVRHNRLMLTGENLQKHPDWFRGLFEANQILDSARG